MLEVHHFGGHSKMHHKVQQSPHLESINILFYVCSHRGDIRQEKQTKTKQTKNSIIICANFPTGLWTIDLTLLVITSVLYKISLTLL